MDDDWREAVLLKAGAAESRFQRGERVTEEDMIAVALAHPEKFEILIREKQNGSE